MANDGAVCLVTGVGPGTGAAVARRFAGGGYRVAMLARSADRLAGLESELPGSRAFACDVANAGMLARVLEDVRETLGDPVVVIHNAVSGSFGTFLDVDPADLERNFRVNVVSLLHLARTLLPDMIARGRGALVVTGNTSALRARQASRPSHPRRRRSASSPSRSPATSGRRACTSPTWSSTRSSTSRGHGTPSLAGPTISSSSRESSPTRSGTWSTRSVLPGRSTSSCAPFGKRGSRGRGGSGRRAASDASRVLAHPRKRTPNRGRPCHEGVLE